MAFNLDTMTIEILEDGTIKTSTDAVSQANHSNAEEFLRFVARMTAGESSRTRRADAHQHSHAQHEHKH